MTTFANSLKSEIARVARKELKGEVLALRKTVAAQRADLVSLKRELKTLSTQMRALSRGLKKTQPRALAEVAAPTRPLRFSAKGFATLRTKLGLSQAQMARLIGASTLSVYKWEKGLVAPRAAQMQKIAGVRGMGKKAAAAMLAELG